MENGRINKLTVSRRDDKGLYLLDPKGHEIFLPGDEFGEDHAPGEAIDVFVYKDGTTKVSLKLPYAQVDEFANLKVQRVSETGAYVDWGFEKDLFVPVEEQMEELEAGKYYVFFVFEDEETGKIRGSQRLEDFVFFDEIDISKGDQVQLLPYRESELGINVIVNNLFQGLLFRSDIHKEVRIGQELPGFVKKVREDGKIDVLLEPLGYKKSIASNTDALLSAIKDAGGFISLSDKSSPEEIKGQLGMSKKAFKRAAGHLYKNKMIDIRKDGLTLLNKIDPSGVKPGDSSI